MKQGLRKRQNTVKKESESDNEIYKDYFEQNQLFFHFALKCDKYSTVSCKAKPDTDNY